ncbi:MAG TPA: tyrosine-type recombinase/integrase [Thermomicrobiales bacterium]|jgi:integrase
MLKRGANHGGTVYKRGTGYEGQVTIAGQRRTFSGKTKTEVREKIRSAVSQAERGVLPPKEKLTVAVFLARWLEDVVEGEVGQRTAETYAYHVRCHIVPHLGASKLHTLRTVDVQRLYRTLSNSGLAPKTVKNVHGVLRKALNQALKWQLVPLNVALAATPPRAERREYTTYSATQIRQLWSSVAGTRWEAFLILAIKTGLRQGELLGLKWADLDLDAGGLQLRRQLQRDKTFQPTKGRRSRRLDLGTMEIVALREHRARQEDRRHGWGDEWAGEDLVFCTDKGRPLGWRDVARDFKILLNKAGLPEIRFHDMRHTNATLLLEQGIHPKVVQERLGHGDISVTLDTYSHVTPTMGKEAARKLDDLFGA